MTESERCPAAPVALVRGLPIRVDVVCVLAQPVLRVANDDGPRQGGQLVDLGDTLIVGLIAGPRS